MGIGNVPSLDEWIRRSKQKEKEQLQDERVEALTAELEKLANTDKTKPKNTNQGTNKQVALAFYYLREAENFKRTASNSADARFIQFLTGRDFDEIRKRLGQPYKRGEDKTGKATKSLIKDLEVIKAQFKSAELVDGMKLIQKDIDILENDLKSFDE
ncbi:hypothetical protein [Carboxylicivirga sp. RSCT41]|uniref:hypothetical protein n=1 Tax=Carboxylicivirga agarovorans TaxID=3417570 RepID=UPI003D34F2B8